MEEPGFGIGGGGFWHTRAFKHGPSNSDVSHRCYIPLRAELRREPHVSATTIRLPESLLARVAKAAEKSGTTPHSFILEAIAEKTELAEQRTALHTLADKRYAQFLESGASIPWKEAHTWLKQRLAGKRSKRPPARKQAR